MYKKVYIYISRAHARTHKHIHAYFFFLNIYTVTYVFKNAFFILQLRTL